MTPRDSFREKWGHRFGLDDETITLMFALEALIDAKLSPAPVGEDGIDASEPFPAFKPGGGPTPPAATSDGGEALALARKYDAGSTPALWSAEHRRDFWKKAAETAERQRDEATALVERLRGRVAEIEREAAQCVSAIGGNPIIALVKIRDAARALLSETQASEGRDG